VWFFSNQSAKSFCVLKVRIGTSRFFAALFFFFGLGLAATPHCPLALTLRLPSPCIGEFPGNSTIERSIGLFVLFIETDCRQLQRVEDVAEVELSDAGDGLAVVSHACAPAESASLRGR